MAECRAAFYARVSSEAQARDHTIASQVAALRERVAADGAAMGPDAPIIDEGHSGSSLVRPALERLRDAVAAGEIDRVYVLAPDRLARRHAHQALLMEEFRRAGVEVTFLNRPIGAGPEDDLLLQIQGVIAEYERAQILERGRRGRRHAARSGSVSALAGAPYGYRYITRERGGGVARFEIVPEEARFVRLIFAWVGLDRLSLREVCRRLQQAGCRTRSGTTRWWASTIHGMVENPAYTGTAMYGRFHAVEPKPRLRPGPQSSGPLLAPDDARAGPAARSGWRCRCRPLSIPLSPRPPGRSLRRTAGASGSRVEGRGGCSRAWSCVGAVAMPITARPRPGLRNAIAPARSAMAPIVVSAAMATGSTARRSAPIARCAAIVSSAPCGPRSRPS